MRARGRLDGYDEVMANNQEKYPDPALPTYEGLSEWIEGEYETRHVSVPYAGIDYQKHTIGGRDVDPDTIEFLP
jgi:hypothetical protein